MTRHSLRTLTDTVSRRTSQTFVVALVAMFALPACVGEFDQLRNDGDLSTTSAADEQVEAGATEATPAEELHVVNPEPEAEPEIIPLEVEEAFIDRGGEVMEVYYEGEQLTVVKIEGEFVYQGDILLPAHLVSLEPIEIVAESGEQHTDEADEYMLTARTTSSWPLGTVTYAIDPNLPSQDRVTDAIAHWQSKTNLTFVERTTESDYVYFTPGGGCSSYVGRVGGRQNVTLASACSTGNVIHEIGHAVGAWHEHSRADRDEYVIVHFENIVSGATHNFKTYTAMGYDGAEFTDALDFGSIMMYSPYSFSNNGQPTITKLDGSTFSVQRTALSDGDISGINQLYGADPNPTPTEPEYVNGQYYTVEGLRVLRYYDSWYYYSRTYQSWMQVELIEGRWYYAR